MAVYGMCNTNIYACYVWNGSPVCIEYYDQENVNFSSGVGYARCDMYRNVPAPTLSGYCFSHWEFTDCNGCCQCVSDNPLSIKTTN